MIRLVVTGGFGNGTFSGTIGRVVTRGYGIGAITEIGEPSIGWKAKPSGNVSTLSESSNLSRANPSGNIWRVWE